MESFFELIFDDVSLSASGETQVCCPFPHHTPEGVEYYETNPSAGVNIDKNLFHCFSCHTGLSEIGFIAKYMDLNYADANKVKQLLSKRENELDWIATSHAELKKNAEWLNTLKELHINQETTELLKLGYSGLGGIDFPVFIFEQLVDVVTYRPGKTPKTKRRKNSSSGMIIPYDYWKHNNTSKATVVCAGEKDMAVARSHGLNAITITGGEGSIPKLFGNDFKNRTVYIVYDNDEAGVEGAKRLAVFLTPLVKKLKIIDLSGTCTEKGEDLWDYFHKYNKTKADLSALIKSTTEFNEVDYQKHKETIYPTIPLIEASSPKYMGKVVRSNIQVISTVETQFQLPSAMTATKGTYNENAPAKNSMTTGQTKSWFLGEHNIKDMLYLIDSRLKESQITSHKFQLMHIPKTEENISIKTDSKETVYKCSLTDVLDIDHDTVQRIELTAYTLNTKLDNGKKYRVTHKLVPHPFDGQKLIMVILDIETVDDSINNFKLTPERIEHLKLFQVKSTLNETLNFAVEQTRGMMNAPYDAQLVLLIDFWFHSVLSFNLGKWENIKGALDVLLVGESRTGKSSTAEALSKRYGVAQIVPLPTTTKAALIGGSNIVQGSYQTRAGIIPMNHGGAVILEELAKAREGNILKELTEIKSSGITRISRVNGTVELPSKVRMLSITNSKTHGTTPKPISSYPNGIAIITDLVGAAEDIARFDIAAVFSFMAEDDLDPFAEFEQPYENEVYRSRIEWVWSRSPEQVIFSPEVYRHLIAHSNRLKKQYNSYIKIFGTEAWKKIARLAIAIAGYVCSTDESYENIIVKETHIDYAVKFMVALYDNPVFRFKEFVEQERKYRDIDAEGIKKIQALYTSNATLLLHLESSSSTTRNTMSAISGLPNDQFSKFVNSLVANLFITFSGHDIHPTERFRKGMKQINRKTQVQKAGRVMPHVNDDVV